MVRYWTSKQLKAAVEDRREEFDLLFEFVNADMMRDENQYLQTRIMDHLRQRLGPHPDICEGVPDTELSTIMGLLQRHLRSRFGDIIENTKMLWEMPLWRISGSIEFTVQATANRFHERFQLCKATPGNGINHLKKNFDLWLIEIIRDLDSSPQRFGQCARCGLFYYSPTEKARTYCSTKCSNAVRQQKFRRERRKKERQDC
jgi:hypothetical protein